MRVDLYTRTVLTVIACALVYLCVVLTPLPALSAQRPGVSTAPGEMVIVGWRAPERLPVQVVESTPLKVTGDVRVSGTVQTEQRPNIADRVVLVGWEERAASGSRGNYQMIDPDARSPRSPGVPVTPTSVK